MNLFVDTSVWSLALRRDAPVDAAEVAFLRQTLEAGGAIFSTGLVLQELLQGFAGPRPRTRILDRFRVLPFVMPDRDDHIAAADVRNTCRHKGVQVGTVDAILAQLCIRHELVMLSTDADFGRIARLRPLIVWSR